MIEISPQFYWGRHHFNDFVQTAFDSLPSFKRQIFYFVHKVNLSWGWSLQLEDEMVILLSDNWDQIFGWIFRKLPKGGSLKVMLQIFAIIKRNSVTNIPKKEQHSFLKQGWEGGKGCQRPFGILPKIHPNLWSQSSLISTARIHPIRSHLLYHSAKSICKWFLHSAPQGHTK